MSMCLSVAASSDANLDRVLDDPPLIWAVVAPDEPGMLEAARAAQRKPSLLSRLFGGRQRREMPGTAGLEPAATGFTNADLDKAWHGIHYLLTGTAWAGEPPLDFLVAGGRAVGDIDVGYGPARVLMAAETARVCDALRAVTDGELRARFDPADMLAKEIYPEIWGRPIEHDDTLGYLMEYVQVLRRFLEQAVARKLGLVIYLS